MDTLKRIAQTLNALSLAVWLGVVVMTGVFAAVTFPTIKELNPTLASHAKYTGEHWLIVAGNVAAKGFFISDMVQFVCAALAIASIGVLWIATPGGLRGKLQAARVVALACVISLFCYYFFVLAPGMSENLRQYWQAAAAGDNATALKFKALFDADHPTSSRVLSSLAVLLLAASALALWPATTTQEPKR
jgi:hypothetical protein